MRRREIISFSFVVVVVVVVVVIAIQPTRPICGAGFEGTSMMEIV